MNWNYTWIFIVSIFLVCCNTKNPSKDSSLVKPKNTLVKVPDTMAHKSSLFYNTKNSLWTLNDSLYSGYAVSFYPDNSLKEKIGILKGKVHDKAIQWFINGDYKSIINYKHGKLHGDKKFWVQDSSSHVLVSHYKYISGEPHGEQKKWYPTGELFKKMNINMGREEGIQQAFRKNGDLYSNYEARNGRIFGLKKSTLCFRLEEEKVVSQN